MNTNELLDRLLLIDHEIQKLFWDTDFHFCDGFSLVLCPNDSDGRFRMQTMTEAAFFLRDFHALLAYLQEPAGRTYTLHLTENNRYGYCSEDGSICEFHCGQPLEALIPDGDTLQWVRTRIEHDSSGFYLVGCHSTPLEGLTIRRRGRHL